MGGKEEKGGLLSVGVREGEGFLDSGAVVVVVVVSYKKNIIRSYIHSLHLNCCV